jgi:hypothetical protein
MTNAEKEQFEKDWAKEHPKVKDVGISDNEHDLNHDMRSLDVPSPMSREDRQGYGDFS